MTLWTNGIAFSNTQLNLWKLSLALAKKHYNSVDLITDSNGYELMKELPFSSFHIQLNNIPNYPTIWSLGKIYAYKYACSIGEHFLHLDGDVLLWEPLPSSIVNSRIFAQSEDYTIMENHVYDVYRLQYDIGHSVPAEWKSNINLMCYNMGIFGGQDIELINGYCDFVIDMINNPIYANLWSGSPGILSNLQDNFNSSLTKSCSVEQANLAIYCKNQGIKPTLLFEHKDDPTHITYKKYSHLITQKNNPAVLQRIQDRLSQDPYDLTPRNVSIQEWHSVN